MVGMRSQLAIQWRARDVHPWDHDLAPAKKEAIFVEQCLADTEAAIIRLFDALPYIDEIEVNVLAPTTESPIMTGTVCRADLNSPRFVASVRMRLRNLGIRCHLAGNPPLR